MRPLPVKIYALSVLFLAIFAAAFFSNPALSADTPVGCLFAQVAESDLIYDNNSPDSKLINKAEKFLSLIVNQKVDVACKYFNNEMQNAMPPQRLTDIWQNLINRKGTFKGVICTRLEQSPPNYWIVYLGCKFKQQSLAMRITFDSNDLICGLHFVPITTIAKYTTPRYAKLDAFTERQVIFGLPDWLLPGVLTVPNGNGSFPVIVLVHGSGPQDKDGSDGGPNKPFRDLASGLASDGIAVMRYDKRTLFYREKLIAAKNDNMTVKEETIDDALAAVEFLKTQPKIDPNRIFVLGHSLGGALIPRISLGDPDIAGFIIMAGATRPLEDSLIAQTKYLNELDGVVTPDEANDLNQLQNDLRQLKNIDLPAESNRPKEIFDIPIAYWRDLQNYNITDSAAKITRPVLVLQGLRDYQVTMTDLQGWKDAFAARKNAVFKTYPNLNHLFMAGNGKPNPFEYDIPNHVDEAVITDIANWLKSQ